MERGRCYACRREFDYDPADVTMFLVDRATGLPPGITFAGTLRPATPEAVARSVDLPICPDCVDKAERGLPFGPTTGG